MDYKEEQDGEFEALQAIYSEELTIISEDPHCFEVFVQGSNEDTRDEHKVKVSFALEFTYVPTYPDEPPLIEVKDTSDNVTEERLEKLTSYLQEEAMENIGMVMVFTLVSAAQDKISDIIQEIKDEIYEKENRAKIEQQKLDEIKYKGTPVTLENFLAWKIRFDEEMIAAGKRKIEDVNKLKKLTGKQLFERDASLFSEAELQYFSSETGVKVDESLFQDLDDLDLEDEDFGE